MSNKFEHMVGGTYLYAGKRHKILSIEFDESERTYRVATDKKEITETEQGMESAFTQVTDVQTTTRGPDQLEERARKQSTDLDAVCDLLMASMKDVQKNPDRVEQALAISQQAQTFINAKKLQLEIAKTVINHSRKK